MSNPALMDLEDPLRMVQPLDVDDARRASKLQAELRRQKSAEREKAAGVAARLEGEYRKARAKAYAAARAAGKGAGEAEVTADGESADARVEWKLQEAVVRGLDEALACLDGERSQLKSLMDWSAREGMS
jgi:flagellar biosynthesis/type III secretory pathway protein FliH